MAFLTDQHIAELGLPDDPTAARTVLRDSGDTYDYIQANAWIGQADLSKWAESEWGDGAPDRLNAAMAVLTQTGRVIDLGAVPRDNPVTP